jgi:hypothetical protein
VLTRDAEILPAGFRVVSIYRGSSRHVSFERRKRFSGVGEARWRQADSRSGLRRAVLASQRHVLWAWVRKTPVTLTYKSSTHSAEEVVLALAGEGEVEATDARIRLNAEAAALERLACKTERSGVSTSGTSTGRRATHRPGRRRRGPGRCRCRRPGAGRHGSESRSPGAGQAHTGAPRSGCRPPAAPCAPGAPGRSCRRC